jgi:rieske iron-sulfur protein
MTSDMSNDETRRAPDRERQIDRRRLLGGALALGAAGRLIGPAAAATDPRKSPPQAGDQLVFAQGERKGQVVRPEDLPLGGPQQLAFPKDPATDTIRDGSRLNQIALIRLDPAELTEETRKSAADGVVAYAATCSHQGCPVSMWKSANSTLYCSCHGTEFDPGDAAKVVKGPAPRRLASLPLTIDEGILIAAGPFTGRVGPQKG